MPQVVMQNPQDLNSIFGPTSAMPGFFGAGQIQQANQINQQNLGAAQQAQKFEAQQQPLTLAEIAARTQHMQAQAGFLGEQTKGLGLENAVTAGIPLQQRIEAKQAELAAKMSDADIKQHENQIQKLLISQDPKQQQLGQVMWDQLSAVKMKKMELASHEAQARSTASIMAASRENAATITGQYRVQAAQARQKQATDLQQNILSGKVKAENASIAFGVLAAQAETDAERENYTKLSQWAEEVGQRQRLSGNPQVSPAAAPGVLQAPKPPGATAGPGVSGVRLPAGAAPAAVPPRAPMAPPPAVPAASSAVPIGANNTTPPPPGGVPALTQEESDAMQWISDHPNDPRVPAIKAKLGIK